MAHALAADQQVMNLQMSRWSQIVEHATDASDLDLHSLDALDFL